MSTITAIKAREILDSRGIPTIEAEVFLNNNISGIASVPSGASTGKKEALELRDNHAHRYMSKGVMSAVAHIQQKIQPALLNKSADEQLAIDNLMIQLDGTENKTNLGANAILAVSLAVARASAKYHNLELYQYLRYIFDDNNDHYILPTPLINIINGGVHADNNLSIQEFMIVPISAPNFKEALRHSVEIFYALKTILKQHKLNTSVGDEGGFAPHLNSHEQAMDYILLAIEQVGLVINKDIGLALDVAASEFFKEEHYFLENNQLKLTTQQLIYKLTEWVNNYPIISIEDGLAENDLIGWMELTKQLGRRIQLVGDDLFVTNPKIFENILKSHPADQLANAILIKPNQIGTLSETFSTIRLAKKYGYNYIISHRSGETEDSFIADLSVATDAKQIKTGSVCRSERVAKYNRLLKIEDLINKV